MAFPTQCFLEHATGSGIKDAADFGLSVGWKFGGHQSYRPTLPLTGQRLSSTRGEQPPDSGQQASQSRR
jgi:hypothetical protein